MRGYFQRLIQQTGLHIGSGGDFRSGGQAPSQIGSKQGGEITPIHVEETKIIEPQQVPRIERRTEGENIAESVPERFEGKIEGKPPIPTADETKTEDQTSKAGEHRPEEEEREIHPAPEEGGMKDRAIEDETFGKSETVESVLPDKEEIRRRDDSSVPTVTIKQRTFEDGKEPEDRPDDEAGRQPTLMEVREWVAETPDAEFEEIVPNEDANQAERVIAKAPFESLAHGESSFAAHPSTIESSPSIEPEIHDFHLSIGTIQITIEEPQKQVRDKRPQKEFQVGESQKEVHVKEPHRVTKERKPAPQAQSTRLARHYIRI